MYRILMWCRCRYTRLAYRIHISPIMQKSLICYIILQPKPNQLTPNKLNLVKTNCFPRNNNNNWIYAMTVTWTREPNKMKQTNKQTRIVSPDSVYVRDVCKSVGYIRLNNAGIRWIKEWNKVETRWLAFLDLNVIPDEAFVHIALVRAHGVCSCAWLRVSHPSVRSHGYAFRVLDWNGMTNVTEEYE